MPNGENLGGADNAGAAPPRGAPWRGTSWRKVLRATTLLVASFFVFPAIAILVLQNDAVATRVANAIAARVSPWPGSTLSAGRVDLTGIGTIALYDARLTNAAGEEMVALDSGRISLHPLRLTRRFLDVEHASISGANVRMRQLPDSSWDLLAPFVSTEPDTGPPFRINVADVTVTGSRIEAHYLSGRDSVLRLEEILLRVSHLSTEPFSVALDTADVSIYPPARPSAAGRLSARGTMDGRTLQVAGMRLVSDSSDVKAAGTISFEARSTPGERPVDFTLVAAPLDFRDIGAFVPGFDLAGSARLDLRVTGSPDSLAFDGHGTTFDGATVDATGVIGRSASAPSRYAVNAKVRGLDPTLWRVTAGSVRHLDADVAVDLTGASMDSLTGTAVVSVDSVRLGEMTVRAAHLDAKLDRGAAQFTLRGRAEPWVSIVARGTARPMDSVPVWQVDMDATQLERSTVVIPAKAGTQGSADVPWVPASAGMTNEAGMTMDVRDARAHIEASGLGWDPASATGRGRASFQGTAGRTTIRDGALTVAWNGGTGDVSLAAPVGDGRIAGTGKADWRGDTVRFEVPSLRMDRVPLTALLGDSAGGTVTADLHGSARGFLLSGVTVEGEAAFAGARWTTYAMDTAHVSLRLLAGDLTAKVTGRGPAGRAALDGHARPFDADPLWVVDHLEVEDLDLAAIDTTYPPSRITGTIALDVRGTAPDVFRGAGRLVLDTSVVRDAEIAGVAMDFRIDSGTVTGRGTAQALAGTLALDASARPFDSVRTLTVSRGEFDHIDLAAFLPARSRTSVSGSFTGDAAFPPGELLTARAVVLLDPSALNQGHLLGGRLMLDVGTSQATLDVNLTGMEGVATISARAGFERLFREDSGSVVRFTDAAADGRITFTDLRPFLTAGVQDTTGYAPAIIDSRFAVRGTSAGGGPLRWQATAQATGGIGAARLDSLWLSAGLADDVLRLDTLIVAGNFLSGWGGGALALQQGAATPDKPLEIHLSADSLDVVGEVFGVQPTAVRGADLDIVAKNQSGDVVADATLVVGGLIAGPIALDSGAFSASAQIRNRRVVHAEVGVHATEAGWGTVHLESLESEVKHDSAGTAFMLSARSDANHELRLAGVGHTVEKTIAISQMDLRLQGERWALVSPTEVSWATRLEFRDLDLRAGTRRIAIDGFLDRQGTQDLALTLVSVPVAGFTEFAGIVGLDGVLDGVLRMTGPATDVRLSGAVETTLEEVRANIAVETAAGRLNVDAVFLDPTNDTLQVSGAVPFSLSIAPGGGVRRGGDMEMNLRARTFGLAALRPFVRVLGVDALEGTLTADATFAGATTAPRLSGTAHVAGGSVRGAIAGTDFDYREVDMDLALAGSAIQVRSLTARADGKAALNGEVEFPTVSTPRVNLNVSFDRFRAARTVSADVRLTGTGMLKGPVESPELTGNFTLLGTDFFADEMANTGAARPVELTNDDLRMLRSYFGYRTTQEATEESNRLLSLAMNIQVTLGSDVWLRRRTQPEMRVQLGGSLEVRKEAGDSIRLFGSVETLPERSFVEELGRRFAVDRGTITFNGPISHWNADIEARYTVPSFENPTAPEAVITLGITGTADSLVLTLGSEPAMETSDILSYLATGRPAASATAFGGNSSAASEIGRTSAGLAAGAVAGALEDAAARAVGLDVVDIRQDGLRGATLVAGRYVSPRLYVGFEQPMTLRADATATTQTGGTRVELEYGLYRWLLTSLQGEESDFRFLFRARRAF